MAVAIKFRTPSYHAVSGISYSDINDKTLVFAGPGPNYKIRVGEYQANTFLSSSYDYKFHSKVNNVQRDTSTKAILSNNQQIDQSLTLNLVPNWAATLNIQFGNATGVTLYNVTSALVAVSGAGVWNKESTKESSVSISLTELCHVSTGYDATGSGTHVWSDILYKTNTFISLVKNPGPSGLFGGVASTGAWKNTHDWHLGVSLSPQDINNAPFMSLSCIIEYL